MDQSQRRATAARKLVTAPRLRPKRSDRSGRGQALLSATFLELPPSPLPLPPTLVQGERRLTTNAPSHSGPEVA